MYMHFIIINYSFLFNLRFFERTNVIVLLELQLMGMKYNRESLVENLVENSSDKYQYGGGVSSICSNLAAQI